MSDERNAMTDVHVPTLHGVINVLGALGTRYRNDWSDVDGRQIRAELDEIAAMIEGAINSRDHTEMARCLADRYARMGET